MPIRVFLADDHATIRDGLRYLLEGQGDMTVVGDAPDGRQAVRLAQQMCPDVVVMDIAMPELNGVEAARQIHAACPQVRVIMLSIHSSAEHVARALQAGAQGYLLKETAGTEVAAAVRAVHAGHRYLSAKIAETVVDDYVSHRPSTSPLDQLSPREREILQLVAEGKSSAEIAEVLSLSVKSVETYRSRMMQKLGLSSLPSLVRFAIQQGLTPLE